MERYRVVSIDPTIQKGTRKQPIYDESGRLVEMKTIEYDFQIGHATDGLTVPGTYDLSDFPFTTRVGFVEVGDILEAFSDPNNGGWLSDISVSRGKNAIPVPAPPEPPKAPEPQSAPVANENSDPVWIGSIMNGEMSGADMIAFGQDYLALRRRFIGLLKEFQQHTANCK